MSRREYIKKIFQDLKDRGVNLRDVAREIGYYHKIESIYKWAANRANPESDVIEDLVFINKLVQYWNEKYPNEPLPPIPYAAPKENNFITEEGEAHYQAQENEIQSKVPVGKPGVYGKRFDGNDKDDLVYLKDVFANISDVRVVDGISYLIVGIIYISENSVEIVPPGELSIYIIAPDDSMAPEIRKDAKVMLSKVENPQTDFVIGERYLIITINHKPMFRRIQYGKTTSSFTLAADNPDKQAYPDIHLPRKKVLALFELERELSKLSRGQ